MKAAVLVFPGSNCDRDAETALARATGRAPLMIWHKETSLPKLDLIVLPGGFSYGDYLRAGAMAAQSPVMRATIEAAARGTRVLGICNGFQILTEAGLLPGLLMRNQGMKFVCRDVTLRVETDQSDFTRAYRAKELIQIPVAHADGNYFADEETLLRLEDQDQVAFRYVDSQGRSASQGGEAASNPNGASHDIAGILNAQKNVLGMMPHPERASEPAHGQEDGARLFQSLIESLA